MINCIVIDDEPLARQGLAEYIAEVDFLRLIGVYDQALKAMEALESGEVKLIFLDIQMPRITGLDFLRSLKQVPPVILVTAYPQYALEGFELHALDYLVKPVSFERFLQSALRAKEYYDWRQENSGSPAQAATDGFFVKADNKLVRIRFDAILFVEALQNYVVIHTTDGKYITYLTFRSVEEFLPADQFARTHKSYLVALDKVDSIEGNELRLKGHPVPVSRQEKDQLLEKLLRGKFLKR
ncbi:LytR/AlgR family response regulator transcription factor [Flavihumibacter petaseus]|uniref:Putative two-component response regulator n=1 Tax=Flavihumibacter petaseus NBRC 106054 TaxID=1220578 RepID=A0A0E9N4K6_9BACT|nr:LytTR family DNA-binding domain-containing protein [Flavihumibacter petaseus]GAO44300.1 putative two-component response regulator [Flavihumibacter petaseus NBRC 106054]